MEENKAENQQPEFVTKAHSVAVPMVQIRGVPAPLGHGQVVLDLALMIRQLQIQVRSLVRAVKSLGMESKTFDMLWLDECQKVADQVVAEEEAAKNKIVVAGQVPPVNGHGGRLGNFKFPSAGDG